MVQLRILTFLVLAFLPVLTMAHSPGIKLAEQDPHLMHLTIDEGLSQGFVTDILEDETGLIWFGTAEGLNRYDGRIFTIYRNELDNPTSLSGNSITQLAHGPAGKIWVGTSQNGLNLFDPRTESATQIPLPKVPGYSAAFSIYKMTPTPNGGVIVLTQTDELVLVNPTATGDIETSILARVPAGNSFDFQYRDILLTGEKDLWFTSPLGLHYLDISQRADGIPEMVPYALEPAGNEPPSCLALYFDNENSLYVGAFEALYKINLQSGTIKKAAFEYVDEETGTRQITLDRNGKIWLGRGLVLLQYSQEIFETGFAPNIPGLVAGTNTLLIDSNEILWVGTNGFGVFQYVFDRPTFYHFRKGDVVYKMVETGKDSIWTPNVLWDLQTGDETIFPDPRLFRNGPNMLFTVHQRNRPWIVYYAQLNGQKNGQNLVYHITEVNTRTGKSARYGYNSPIPGAYRFRNVIVHYGSSDTLWLISPHSLIQFNPVSKEFIREIPFGFTMAKAFVGQQLTSVAESPEGNIWFGGQDGLIFFNRKTRKFTRYHKEDGLLDPHVISLHLRQNGNLWVGTRGSGVFKLDAQSQQFTRISTRDGLPNNVIYGILEDESGYLWMSSNKGISRYHPETGSITNFTVKDGLQSNEFNTYAHFKGKDGRMFFGGINGITAFYPAEISNALPVPIPYITGLRINGQPISFGDSTQILQQPIRFTDEIFLTYDQNMVSVEFSGIDFVLPQENEFKFRLTGLTDQWSAPSQQRLASYTNLAPGTYTFEVQSRSRDNAFSAEPARLTIHIAPPWWRTKIAYFAYLLLAAIGIWGIFRLQSRRLRLRHGMETQRLEAARLRELDLFKQRFYGNITHEFRTPLSLIMGPADRLLDQIEDKEARQNLLTIKENSTNLLDLVNQMLELSRLEDGRLQPDLKEGLLSRFLHEIWLSFLPSAREKGISWHFRSEIAPEPSVFDGPKLRRIVTNLLSNAYKFTPPGGRVVLKVSHISADRIQITVEDTGEGISSQELPRIFDRFFRVSKTSQPGTGIGLALVKELITYLKGTISVTSEPGSGSVFKVEIPVNNRPAAEPFSDFGNNQQGIEDLVMPAPKSEQTEHSSSPSGPQNTLLIVEDNSDLRRFICTLFQEDYEVIEAPNGLKGLESAISVQPDLIISDLMMDEMDGLEMLAAIREDVRTSHIPVILLTARSAVDIRLDSFRQGADAYVNKPFHPEELIVRVKSLMERRAALQARLTSPEAISEEIPAEIPSADEQFLRKVREVILENLDNTQFSAEDLAAEMAMSRSQLYRKIKAMTDLSINQYVRKMRLSKARELLKMRHLNISEVGYQVGFSSNTYFSKCFREAFGQTPSEFVEAHS